MVEKLDDGELDARLYAREPSVGRLAAMPDYAWIDTERRRVGVTLEPAGAGNGPRQLT